MAPRRAGDADMLVADSAKAREVLGWQPGFADVREIIETAWRWHKDQRF
jgi:UDP-glucose 4-epimerase